MGGGGECKGQDRGFRSPGVRETRELRRCGSGRQETKAKPGVGSPGGHRPKVTWGCRVKAAETGQPGGGGVAGGGTGCEDFVGGGGGGRQGAPRGSPRCLGGSTETLAMARPSEGSGSREPARFYLFLGRSQFALSGFFRHPGTGRGKGGPHQHDPVNLCGIASGSLRAAVPLSPERAAPGRY